MKKIYLTLLPLLLITSCSSMHTGMGQDVNAPYVVKENGMVNVYQSRSGDNSHITYIMMSPYGYLHIGGEKIYGGDVEEKFYENCYVYRSAPGADLPGEYMKSDVDGSTFERFVQYRDSIYPVEFTKVPENSGETIYAIFKGTKSSGGGSGGGGTVEPSYGVRVNGTTVYEGYYSGKAIVEGVEKDEYVIRNVEIKEGDKFAAYNIALDVEWTIGNINPWSFGKTQEGPEVWGNYISVDSSGYTAKADMTIDVYIQLKFENDTIYFELKK